MPSYSGLLKANGSRVMNANHISLFRYIWQFFSFTYILKRKSFATLTKMLVPFFGPKQSLSDNSIDKCLYFPCIKHKNQNGVAYGCRAGTIILRQTPIFKVALLQYLTCYAKNLFKQYLFSNAERKTNLNQVNLCLRHCSLRLRNVLNFLTLLAV